jgi:hypothetical protein
VLELDGLLLGTVDIEGRDSKGLGCQLDAGWVTVVRILGLVEVESIGESLGVATRVNSQ